MRCFGERGSGCVILRFSFGRLFLSRQCGRLWSSSIRARKTFIVWPLFGMVTKETKGHMAQFCTYRLGTGIVHLVLQCDYGRVRNVIILFAPSTHRRRPEGSFTICARVNSISAKGGSISQTSAFPMGPRSIPQPPPKNSCSCQTLTLHQSRLVTAQTIGKRGVVRFF